MKDCPCCGWPGTPPDDEAFRLRYLRLSPAKKKIPTGMRLARRADQHSHRQRGAQAMNQTKLNRVAQAICRERCAAYGDPPCHLAGRAWERCDDDESCEALARAAIEAMDKNDE